ncbi:MAG TPA: hypothetical protein VGG45_17230 [Terracidiphilus sp.]
MRLRRPTALFEARADTLAAAFTAMQKPLGAVDISDEQFACLLAKEAVAGLDRYRHQKLFLASN